MNKIENLKVVYIVTCFQNILGVYADPSEAHSAQMEMIQKNRPADIICRAITYPNHD